MRTGRKIRAGSVLFALCLCACASKPDEQPEPNIPPTNYKTEILDYLRTALEDPTNIRDALLAEPVLKQHNKDTRYVACLRFNARNREGNYVGNREVAAFFFAGTLAALVTAPPDLCKGSNYQPFPELQRLCREVVCPKRRV
jgi:hypothetical protein